MATQSAGMKLRAKLLERKQALLGTDNPVYNTNCMYRPNQGSERYQIDLRTAGENAILGAYKSLLNHEQACKDLDIELKHLGFEVQEWRDDMKTRVGVIHRDANLRRVAILETKLRSILTPKELREIGIADLEAEMENI